MSWSVFGQNGEEELTWTPEYGYAFVYVLLDPRDQTVRYVGKCQNPRSRLSDHMSARSKGGGSRYEWTQELKRLGLSAKMHVLEKVSLAQSHAAERKWMEFYGERGSLLNENRIGMLPLPEPFDKVRFRLQICIESGICDTTVQKWAGGVQTVTDRNCRDLLRACQALGVVPPLGAKLPTVGIESAKPHLRALS